MYINILVIILLIWIYFRYFGPLIITFKKVTHTGRTPTKSYGRAACWDVYCSGPKTVPPNGWREIPIGIAFAPWPHIYIPFLKLTLTPFGNVAYQIHTRSGLALKGLRNHLGVIDNDYRKELTIIVYNRKDFPVVFKIGDKIAQLEFYRVPSVWMIQRKKLSKSLRNEKGFGSSGK